jgi:hypothetical protein
LVSAITKLPPVAGSSKQAVELEVAQLVQKLLVGSRHLLIAHRFELPHLHVAEVDVDANV